MNKNLSIIVASSLEYGIGFENKLCWNIPEELKYLRGDSTKIRNTLGWKPDYTFEMLMDEMIDHWDKQIRINKMIIDKKY